MPRSKASVDDLRRDRCRVMVTLDDLQEVWGAHGPAPMSFLTFDVKRSIGARIGLKESGGGRGLEPTGLTHPRPLSPSLERLTCLTQLKGDMEASGIIEPKSHHQVSSSRVWADDLGATRRGDWQRHPY